MTLIAESEYNTSKIETITYEPVEVLVFSSKRDKETCPECGSSDIIMSGHCTTCMSCGWSACSL